MIRPIYSHHETIGGETVRVLEGYEADEATKAAATIVYGTKPDTYRELLELAAKAAGITGFLGAWFDDGYQRGFLSGRLGNGHCDLEPTHRRRRRAAVGGDAKPANQSHDQHILWFRVHSIRRRRRDIDYSARWRPVPSYPRGHRPRRR